MPEPISSAIPSRRRLLIAVVFAFLGLGSFCQLRYVGEFAQRTIQWQHPGIGGGDIYPVWFATKAALRGADPYSPAVTRQIQTDIYGHPLSAASPWAKQSFVYPAHVTVLLAPLTLLPWSLVCPLFPYIGFPCVALAAFLWLRLYQPALSVSAQLLIIGLCVISWPAVTAFGVQPTVYIAVVMALAVVCFHRGADLFAGILLAIATVKPHIVLLLIAYCVVLAFRERRWRFLASFAVTLTVLLAASLRLVPGWIPQWIKASLRDAGVNPLVVTLAGHRIGAALWIALLLAVVFRIWKQALDLSRDGAFPYGVALLLAATVCLIPSTAWMVYNDLLLIPAILLLLPRLLTTHADGLLCGLAQVGLVAGIFCAPACAALGLILGYSAVIALSPSMVLFLMPLTLIGAILAFNPARVSAVNSVPATQSV
jgi:hypothetical protein